jgi:hypothetical protein
MDELEISGRRYISTRRAAKEHKYNSDYIGQLIRGRKVPGQKVGRAWYVDAEALQAYFNGEDAMRLAHKGPAVLVSAAEAPSEAMVTEVEVAPEAGEEPQDIYIEQTTEEYSIPVHIQEVVQAEVVHEVVAPDIMPAPEPVHEFKVQVRTAPNTEELVMPTTQGGLTYIADNSQLIPNLRKHVPDPFERMQVAHTTPDVALQRKATKPAGTRRSVFAVLVPALVVVATGAAVGLAVVAAGAQTSITVATGMPPKTATVISGANFASFIESVKRHI